MSLLLCPLSSLENSGVVLDGPTRGHGEVSDFMLCEKMKEPS